MSETGRIVVLNGSSSAGKTTLAQQLQYLMQEPYQHIALDHFRDGMPPRFRGLNSPAGTPGARGLNVVPVHDGEEYVTQVRFGDVGHAMLRGMHRSIASFAEEGCNVIVDDLLLDAVSLRDYVQVLAPFYVLFVGVRCPIEVVNERESLRPGRFPGTAKSHFYTVHEHDLYDLEVNTASHSPAQCAEKVRQFLISDQRPTAFAQLKDRFSV